MKAAAIIFLSCILAIYGISVLAAAVAEHTCSKLGAKPHVVYTSYVCVTPDGRLVE